MNWTPSNLTASTHLGMLEFQSNDNEWHSFEIMQTDTRLVFGNFTNNSFLESGYMELDTDLHLDCNLQELYADIEVYYNDGLEFTTLIVCNQRM